MIPRILHRTVPETSPDADVLWDGAVALHPGWEHRTWRDPINPEAFPLTSHAWDQCRSGAQMAGLIRLEALWHHGGIYLDSDIEMYRPLDSLCGLDGFSIWEDARTAPDFVLGAAPHHPAIMACIDLALERLASDSTDWRTGPGAWGTGPGVTTTILPGRTDWLLLPPGSFAPYHYSERHRAGDDHRTQQPWAFGAHHWRHSWAGH